MVSSSRDELLRREPDIVIDVQGLRVVRGKRVALDDVSVQIARGTITGLLGPSGCGKTTLMRSIVGTQIIEKGTVTVLGRPAGAAELRHRVGSSRKIPPSTTTFASSTTCATSRRFMAPMRRRRIKR